MTYEELQNLTPEEIEKLQKENDNETTRDLLLAFLLLIKVISENGRVRLYIRNGDPVPISGTANLGQLSKELDTVITAFLNRINVIVTTGIEKSLILGDQKSMVDVIDKITPDMFKQLSEKGLFAQRKSALDEFLIRKTKGLKLSERVWKLKGPLKFEIEQILQLGVVDGRGAAQIARDLTRHLQEPDKLFRRIAEAKTGGLKLSKAAEAYNPGRGVYRSSYKNALRLARNEINKAYRLAQYDRIQSLPFVTGIKISLSGSHPDRMPKGDICDELQGIYPKTVKWSGWHVMCMCRVTSVLASDKEIGDYLATYDTSHPNLPPQIKTLPESIKSWASENKDRYQSGRVDWIDDNKDILSMLK